MNKLLELSEEVRTGGTPFPENLIAEMPQLGLSRIVDAEALSRLADRIAALEKDRQKCREQLNEKDAIITSLQGQLER